MSFQPTLRSFITCTTLILLGSLAQAEVSVKDPWVRGTVQGQKATGAFMQLTSTEPVRLVEAKSEVAKTVEIHEMRMDGDRMVMRAVPGLDVLPGKGLELKPGGYHVMLFDVVKPLNAGDKVPLTLVLEAADKKRTTIAISAEVRALHAGSKPAASVPARLQAEQAIRHLMMHTFDKPQERLSVDPVVVHGDHAVAGWVQGGRGGRALLVRDPAKDAWRIVLCAGDGLRDATLLRTSGVPLADARALAQALVDAEAELPGERRALLSSFEGVVRLDSQGHPGPAHGGHAGH